MPAGERHQPGAVRRACRARSPWSCKTVRHEAEQNLNTDLGFFVQDTWTIDRLTLNVGGRYDMLQRLDSRRSRRRPQTWIQARNFAEIPDVPDWNDWSVRLAGAYDLFGNGKTALKANASKYIAAAASGYTQNFNPMSYSTQIARLGRTSIATSRSSTPTATSSSTR